MMTQKALFPKFVPLPPNPFGQANEPSFDSAYKRCLEMERRGDPLSRYDPFLIHSRYLGYLITLLPKDGALAVVNEIHLCNQDDERLNELAEFYIYHLIGLFTASRERTPYITPSESFFGSNLLVQGGLSFGVANPAPEDHTSAKKLALIRDGLRCIVSGCVDSRVFDDDVAEQQGQAFGIDLDTDSTTPTNYCHIFSPDINWDFGRNDLSPQKVIASILSSCTVLLIRWSSSISEILRSFGTVDLTELMGSKAYSLANGFTLNTDLRPFYDDLEIWLEHLPDHQNANTYQIQTVARAGTLRSVSGPITLKSTNPSTLPVPEPRYLKIRATISQVAQLSGAASRLRSENYKASELPHLANDGSSANILASRLQFLSLTT